MRDEAERVGRAAESFFKIKQRVVPLASGA
jgi:hypothetical protein